MHLISEYSQEISKWNQGLYYMLNAFNIGA